MQALAAVGAQRIEVDDDDDDGARRRGHRVPHVDGVRDVDLEAFARGTRTLVDEKGGLVDQRVF